MGVYLRRIRDCARTNPKPHNLTQGAPAGQHGSYPCLTSCNSTPCNHFGVCPPLRRARLASAAIHPSPSQPVRAAHPNITNVTMARPSSYKPEFAKQAEKLCLLGATDIEMADFFEVALSTISKWKHDYPEFSEALKAGKALADERVERSLYQKAVGYTFEAVKIFMPAGADGPVYAPYREHVPPDTTACIFWLKNRRQQQWRDVHKHEHGRPGEFDEMNADQLRDHVRREAEALGVGMPDIADQGGSGEGRSKPH